MYRNSTKVPQQFYHRGELVTVYPGFCVEEDVYREVKNLSVFEKFDSDLPTFLKKYPKAHVVLLRQYAFGDVYQLYVLLRALLKVYPEAQFTIVTSDRHAVPFRECPNPTFSVRPDTPCDLGINLDGILEKDHRGAAASYKHRIRLYAETLSVDALLNL